MRRKGGDTFAMKRRRMPYDAKLKRDNVAATWSSNVLGRRRYCGARAPGEQGVGLIPIALGAVAPHFSLCLASVKICVPS